MENIKEEILRAPEITPRFRVWKSQWPGFIILFLIPILALFGVFGDSSKKINQVVRGTKVAIIYPSIFRYGQSETLEVKVSNNTDHDLSDLKVSFSPDYIVKFASVSFVPSAERSFHVPLGRLSAGDSRTVLVSLTAEKYGYHHGRILVSNGETPLIASDIKTLVFP